MGSVKQALARQFESNGIALRAFFIATPAYVRVDPSKCNGILDLLEFGLLPDLKAISLCLSADYAISLILCINNVVKRLKDV
jgi:hypothetical protein